ncbi:MAG TPA: GxxExxY protein [Spirochaetota bacterium]|nr:GxxExxY protein [Spirochaetota bacterium]
MSKINDTDTYSIINCALTVYQNLGYGFLEVIYKNAMKLELSEKNISFTAEKKVNIYYKNHIIGRHYIDLFIYDSIVVELKTTATPIDYHIRQVKNYLKSTNTEIGLLFNFAPNKLLWKRIYYNPDIPKS